MGSQWVEDEEEEGGASSWEICDALGKGQLAGSGQCGKTKAWFVCVCVCLFFIYTLFSKFSCLFELYFWNEQFAM